MPARWYRKRHRAKPLIVARFVKLKDSCPIASLDNVRSTCHNERKVKGTPVLHHVGNTFAPQAKLVADVTTPRLRHQLVRGMVGDAAAHHLREYPRLSELLHHAPRIGISAWPADAEAPAVHQYTPRPGALRHGHGRRYDEERHPLRHVRLLDLAEAVEVVPLERLRAVPRVHPELHQLLSPGAEVLTVQRTLDSLERQVIDIPPALCSPRIVCFRSANPHCNMPGAQRAAESPPVAVENAVGPPSKS
mmetsp:Transcript_131831/g.409837  ORF Transcript_131831/g.409837 Transcript_131831/m.409837 type:complete len:248 (-) Transcript_131831:343-1086(-)